MRRVYASWQTRVLLIWAILLLLQISDIALIWAQEGLPTPSAPAPTETPTMPPTETPLPTLTSTATETATATPTETATASETPTENPTSIPTAPATEVAPTETTPVSTIEVTATLVESPAITPTKTLVPEPELALLFSDNFDGSDLSAWSVGLGWELIHEQAEGGALQIKGSAEPLQLLQPNTLYNVVVQARFHLSDGIVRLCIRQSAGGDYAISLDSNGQAALYRANEPLQIVAIPIPTDQWHTLRLSAMENAIRVSMNDIEIIAVQDSAPLPAGAISITGAFVDIPDQELPLEHKLKVDDFLLWVPVNELPDIPTATPTSTSTITLTPESTATPTVMPTVTPTKEPLPPEPALSLLVSDAFDGGGLSAWVFGAGWALISNEEGQALQVSNSDAPVIYGFENFLNTAVQARFLFNQGAARIYSRQSDAGSYMVSVDTADQVALYRGETLLASATIPSGETDQWRVLRLSAMEDVLRVSVDGVEVIAIRDAEPLPSGTVALAGYDIGDSALMADDFSLWIPSADLPAAPTPTPEPEEDEPVLTLIVQDNFDSGELVDWTLRPGWSLVPSEGGQALAVFGSHEAATYGLNNFSDLAAQARFLLSAGSARLSLRQSDTGVYTASLGADGQIVLLRGQTPLASASITPTAGAWHTLRFLAVADTLRVIVDGQTVIDVTDPSPLPAGGLAVAAQGIMAPPENETGASRLLMDDFELWMPATTQAAMSAAAANTTIGDWVWLDRNTDGIQDFGEPGIAGVTVKLFRTSGLLVATDITDANGYYSFSVPGSNYYYVRVILPVRGYDFTYQNQGYNDYYDSDVDPFTGKTSAFYVYSGYTYSSIDVGLIELYECDAAIDLMIVIDGSGSINPDAFNITKGFARGLVNSFVIGPASARIGVVQFASEGSGRVHIALTDNRSALLSTIQIMTQIGDATDIEEGVTLAQNQLATRGRGAPIPRAMVVLTDGGHNQTGDPVLEAGRAKNAGTVIYVVAVEPIDWYYINGVASDPDSEHVFEVLDLHDLAKALYDLAGATCGTPKRPPAPRLTAPASGYLTNDSAPTTFSWTAVSLATQYEIQFDTDSAFGSPDKDVMVTDTTLTTWLGLPDGRYYWRVRGWNGNVPGAWSLSRALKVDLIPPPAPRLISPLDKAGTNDTTPAFTWGIAPTATLYHVEIATDPGFTSVVASATLGGTTYVQPTRLPYGRYYWRAQARDAAGNWGGWSGVRSFDITIMRSPTNGSFTIDTTPTFAWYLMPGGKGYEFQLATDEAFSNMIVNYASISQTSYTIPNASPLSYGFYYWRVNVDMGSGFFETSPVYWLVKITPQPPVAPKLINPAANAITNDNTPEFTWDVVAGGVTYQIVIDNNWDFSSPEQDAITSGPSYIALALADGQRFWRVRALNYLDVPGAWSLSRSFKVDTLPPPAPILVGPVDGLNTANTKPVFSWRLAAGAKFYELQLGNTTPPTMTVRISTSTSYTPPSPLLLRTYYWRVRAIDAAGNFSAWSDIRQVTINSPFSAAPVLNRFITSTPTLSWTRVTWATGYEIRVDDNRYFTSVNYRSGLLSADTLSHMVSPGLPNGTWHWQVRAQTSAGTFGPWSSIGKFTIDQ